MADRVICTVGHGNRTSEELQALLVEAGVRELVDVRAHPGSRRHPQFSRATLAEELGGVGIGYTWSGQDLGGRRRPKAGSRHTAWRNDSFRAYADHMESAEFAAAIDRLLARAGEAKLAIMCAERLPWQCHRYLISDFLVMRGVAVTHLIGSGSAREHALNPMARIEHGLLVYDRGSPLELGLD